jgi:hypothetical protein
MPTQKGMKSRKRARKNNKGLQSNGAMYNYKTVSAPVHAPLFPTETSVALKWYDNGFVSSGVQQRIVLPIVEMLSHKPQKLDQYFQMYTFYKLTAISVKLKLASTSTGNPFLVTGGVLPYAGSTSITSFDLANVANARNDVVALGTKTVMSWDLGVERYLGNVFQTSQFWIDEAQSASTSPVSQEEPALCIVIQHPTGKEMQYVFELMVTYHCQFFDPLVKF